MQMLINQILKFGVVGVLATLIDYGVLMLLSQGFGMDPVLAAGISFSFSLLFNYLPSICYWVPPRREGARRRSDFIFLFFLWLGLSLLSVSIGLGPGRVGGWPLLLAAPRWSLLVL